MKIMADLSNFKLKLTVGIRQEYHKIYQITNDSRFIKYFCH